MANHTNTWDHQSASIQLKKNLENTQPPKGQGQQNSFHKFSAEMTLGKTGLVQMSLMINPPI